MGNNLIHLPSSVKAGETISINTNLKNQAFLHVSAGEFSHTSMGNIQKCGSSSTLYISKGYRNDDGGSVSIQWTAPSRWSTKITFSTATASAWGVVERQQLTVTRKMSALEIIIIIISIIFAFLILLLCTKYYLKKKKKRRN